MAKAKSVAPLSKSAAQKQRAKVAALKGARKSDRTKSR